MDIRKIIAPTVSDRDALEEFVEALADITPGIERDVARLKDDPEDREVIGNLFRSIHNIKGDATLCRVDLATIVVHPIETALARFRNHEIAFSDILAEAILLALDRLELATEGLLSGKPLDNLKLLPLVQGLEKISLASPDEIDARASEMVEAVTGFRPVAEALNLTRDRAPSTIGKSTTQSEEDLRFFRSLAEQFEARSLLFKGRTMRLLRLAMETNLAREKAVDPVQLEAAIYMHDVGMMFLPEPVWLKTGRMTVEEKLILRSHPGYAAGILARMPGWDDAAKMVEQHHETPDGTGYPAGIPAGQICDGAKILAIVDAFEAVMLKHIDRGKNRSVLRAIAEINACDNQFAPEWIEPFNQVIHRTFDR